MRIKLFDFVFYNRYLQEMIVYNTKQHSVFVVNDAAADILEILQKSCFLTLDVIVKKLSNIYGENIGEEDISLFLIDLYHEGIIEIEGKRNTRQPQDSVSYFGNIDYNSIESEFEQKLRENNVLFSALIELTYNCNLKCIHCYAIDDEPNNNELSREEIYGLLDDLKKAGVFKLTLTGGELFTRKDIFEILEYCMNLGFLIDIFTNGNLLNEDRIKKLSELNIRSVQCSLYGANASIHETISGVQGSFDKTVKCLELCKKYNIATNIKTVLMNPNFSEYDKLEKLSKRLNSTFQTSSLLIPRLNGSFDNLVYAIDDANVLKEIFNKRLIKIGKPNYFRKTDLGEPICGMGRSAISIDPFGDIYPCNVLKYKIGNIREDCIKSLWENSEKLSYLRGIKKSTLFKCSSCTKREYCFFCPGAALAYTGSMIEPYEEACIAAGIKYDLDKEVKK